MKYFKNRAAYRKICRDEKGATAIEYGLILSLIVIGLIAALGSTGDSNKDKWDANAEKIVNATTS